MAVIARRIDPAGAPMGNELIVEPDTTDFIGADQQVAAGSNGHFLVGYRRQDSGNDSHSYVRAANADGSFADVAHAVSPVGQSQPIVALDDRGVGLAVFGFTASGSMSQVVDGQLLGPGATPFGDLTPLSGGDRAGSPSLANDPATGVATVTWAQLQGSKQVAMARRYLEPPTCSDSTATVTQGRPIDAPLACAGIGVNGARVVTSPAHGKVGASSMTGPSIRYTPTPGYQGHDSFVVEGLNDGGGSNDVTVRVAVNRDTIRPTIKTFKLRRMRAAAAKRNRTTSPYSFALKFSEPSTVKVKIQRPVRGIRSGRRCRIPRPGTDGGRCTIYKTLGSVSSKKLADATALRVPSRLVKRLSKYGAVRATATARDGAGNASKPRRLKVRFKL
jgi:hypothetical protein